MMWCCFDFFIPEVVPNNINEQYEVKPNDIFVLCCDGVSDWVSEDKIFKTLGDCGLEDGINKLIVKVKEISLSTRNSFDDITAIAIKWSE